MFDKFFPDRYVASTYVIDFEGLYKEGVRGLIFDIDNTLVPHGAPADERNREWRCSTKISRWIMSIMRINHPSEII